MSKNPEITPETSVAEQRIMPIFKKVLNAHFHYDFAHNIDETAFEGWIASHDNLDGDIRDTFIDLLTVFGVFTTRKNASELANFMKEQENVHKFSNLTEEQQQDIINLCELLHDFAS